MLRLSRKKQGLSLVEVIIASAIILFLAVVLVSANLAYFKSAGTNLKNVKAIYLAEEGVEAVNFLKNKAWAGLGTVGTDYYLLWNGTTWLSTTTPNVIDQLYRRKFVTESVNRDASSDITVSGGTPDANTRKLTVSVSWTDASGTTTKTLSAYLMKNQ